MKSFVSNDNTPNAVREQGSVRLKVEPTCHSLVVHGEFSWEAIEILDSLFVALGEFKQAIQIRRTEEADRESRRAANDNVYEARKQASLEQGKGYADELQALRKAGISRHNALSEIAKAHDVGIKDVERYISLFNRFSKRERQAKRQAKVAVLMRAGKSASEIGKELGVSKSEAHRIMKSVQETDDE